MTSVRIISTGKALPSHVVTSEDLDRALAHSAGHSLRKGGVRVRYIASTNESQSQLGAAALHDALKTASIPITSIDLLLSACGVQEQALPSTACAIAEHAKLPPGTPAFDVNASCLSFLVALEVASSLIAAGRYSRIAVVSSDLPSRGVNWDDPEASLIFGDGAAAAIVEKGNANQGIRAFKLKTYTEGRTYCEIRAGGTRLNPRTGAKPGDYLFRMNGKAVFKMASKAFPSFLTELMSETPFGMNDIDLVVPHQASHLSMAHIAKTLDLPSSKIINIYESHGNQVAASIPTALHEAILNGRAREGTRLLMLGSAAGLSLGGLLLDL
jgi:3-oxoacyl-[acyl-carrier-protein] synthase-3